MPAFWFVCWSVIVTMQDEAKQANEAAHHAQGVAYSAQQELAHERTRAQELQVRCLQFEEECARLGSEILSLHTQSDTREAELSKWKQEALSPASREAIIASIGKLFSGYVSPCAPVPSAHCQPPLRSVLEYVCGWTMSVNALQGWQHRSRARCIGRSSADEH